MFYFNLISVGNSIPIYKQEIKLTLIVIEKEVLQYLQFQHINDDLQK